ncbi:hypothetical protein HYU92_02200 [Candidatus Curtissbacteria bacterium]|nr:hypothetical protein [Candidatus Curtissbacteria bacterium]
MIILFAVIFQDALFSLIFTSTSTSQNSNSDLFKFAEEQRFTDDEQFKILKRDEKILNLGRFGTEYYRYEEHQGITGGLYSGQPIGATVNVCYVGDGDLTAVVDKIDSNFKGNSWIYKPVPGYTLETLKQKVRQGFDLSGYDLLYTKQTDEGTEYGTIGFPQKNEEAICGDFDKKYPNSDFAFSLHLHFIK